MGWQYVIPGYVATFGTLGIYSILLVRRGRQLSKRVPDGSRRFLGKGRV